MSAEWLAPAMFAGALALLALGYPVAFSLGGVALLFAAIGTATGSFDPVFLSALPQRIFGIMGNYTLLAVPYFIFMGSMLEKSGLAERLLETMGILFGRLRGGLALAVVVVGTLLAASTGVIAATVVAMGLISLPVMLRYGYDSQLATGTIVASGTLGQIVPPSIVLVVLGDQLGISVGDLFLGALLPGTLMAAAFAVHVLVVAGLRPDAAPALPSAVRDMATGALIRRILGVMLPPLALIAVVLGSIFFGVATPTEAGAIGSLGATALAAASGRLSLPALKRVSDATLRIATMVLFILLGSTAFSLVFRGLGGDRWMFDLLANLPGGQTGFLAASMLTVFLLGFFIDFFEIAFIVVPLFAPVAESLGMSLVWYGVILGANLQTSFLTPPFGFALFYLRGVAPNSISTQAIYRGALPFIAIQLLVLVAIVAFPELATFLPSLKR